MGREVAVNGRIGVAVVSIATTVVLTPTIQTSAQRGKVGVVATLEGSVSVTRQATESRPLASNEDVLAQNRIVTAGESKAVIEFATKATVVLGYGSVLTISEESGSLMLDLDNGVVNYGVSREGNRSDEPQAVRTPNAIARTTGRLLVRVSRESAGGVVTTMCVWEGHGSAAVLEGAKIDVPEGNCVTVNGSALGTIFPMPPPPVPARGPHIGS